MIGVFIALIGSVIAFIGGIGLVRFPDVYTRSHAQTVVNVGGACLMLIGFMIESWESPSVWKILIILIAIFVTSPTATHAITKAAYMKNKVKENRNSMPS